jgi:hypothetical protein
VLATGTRTNGDLPWKASLSGYQATKDNLHKYQDLIKHANSIVIGGGGATGVETAGELGFEYGKTKDITLITAAPELVPDGLILSASKAAEKELKRMHVTVTKGVKITDSATTAEGKTELSLDNGQKKVVDLYLPTTGNYPNSEYIPKALLDDKGHAVVDGYLRVKSADAVWAVGDISNADPSQIVYLMKQIPAVSKNIDLVLKGKQPIAYKTGGDREFCSFSYIFPCPLHCKRYLYLINQITGIMAVTLGRSKGTGRAGNWKLPSLMVWWVSKCSPIFFTLSALPHKSIEISSANHFFSLPHRGPHSRHPEHAQLHHRQRIVNGKPGKKMRRR